VIKRGPQGKHRGNRAAGGLGRSVAGESLVRNSGFLIANLLLGAACGYGAVSLLTRLYSVQAVGLSATAVSISGLIVFVTQFGVNYSLPRFLPVSKNRQAVINTVLTVTVAAALLGAALFLVLPVAGKLYALGGGFFAIAFLLATSIDSGESVLETVMVADRSSDKLARSNAVPNLIKLAAPPAFIFAGSLGAYVARFVSDLVASVVFARALWRKGHRFRFAVDLEATREMRGFSFGMYLASLVGSLPLMVLPIIILSRFGASASAYWSVAMSMALLLIQLPGAVGQALLPEVAHRPGERRHLLWRALMLTAAIVVPVLVIAYFGAPLGLAVFGRQYVTGALGILRWLIVTVLITLTNYVTGTILYLARKTLVISVINVVDAVVVLGLALVWARNAQDVAISWVVGDVGNTILFTLFAFVAVRQVGGRWDELGVTTAGQPGTGVAGVPASSQQQALDVLLELARLQRQASIYSARDLTETQPGLGWAYELAAYRPEEPLRRDRRGSPRSSGGRRAGRR